MKKTQLTLMAMFVGLLCLAVIVVVLYETNILTPGENALNKESEFLGVAIMELATLGCVFLGLRLFKFKQIHQSLVTEKAPALMKFGTIRLLLLELPMLVNTLLYYIYMNTTFGYLGIMLLLCLPFVFPSLNRCEGEVTE